MERCCFTTFASMSAIIFKTSASSLSFKLSENRVLHSKLCSCCACLLFRVLGMTYVCIVWKVEK